MESMRRAELNGLKGVDRSVAKIANAAVGRVEAAEKHFRTEVITAVKREEKAADPLILSREVQRRAGWLESERGSIMQGAAEDIINTGFLQNQPLCRALMLSMLHGIHGEYADRAKFKPLSSPVSPSGFMIGFDAKFTELDKEYFEARVPGERTATSQAMEADIIKTSWYLWKLGLAALIKDHPVRVRLTPVGEAAIRRYDFVAGRRGLRYTLRVRHSSEGEPESATSSA